MKRFFVVFASRANYMVIAHVTIHFV